MAGVVPGTPYWLSPFLILQGNGVAGAGPTGVYGFSDKGAGVQGYSDKGVAVRGTVKGAQQGLFAGVFDGPVHVNGAFSVSGAKMAAVPFPDGSHRGLYCMESPECWFEDFGDGKLVKGKAKIKLPPDFAAVIKADSYHVFVTPYGNSNGLYVSKRNRQGFAVEEQGNGKSNLKFSFRIVGKRKGVKAERFAKVPVVQPPKLLSDRKKKEQPPRKPAIGPFSSGVLSTVTPRRSSR